ISTLGSLVKLSQAQGRYSDAEPLLAEINAALNKFWLEFDGPDPRFAHRVADMATLMRGQRKFRESEAMLREALEIYDQAPPENPSDYAQCVLSLAIALRGQNRMQEAEESFQQALKLYTKTLKPGHR